MTDERDVVDSGRLAAVRREAADASAKAWLQAMRARVARDDLPAERADDLAVVVRWEGNLGVRATLPPVGDSVGAVTDRHGSGLPVEDVGDGGVGDTRGGSDGPQ
jgi:hypothetical protein